MSQLTEISIKILYFFRLDLQTYWNDYTHTHEQEVDHYKVETFMSSKGMYVA